MHSTDITRATEAPQPIPAHSAAEIKPDRAAGGVQRTAPEIPLIDLMGGSSRAQINVLDHGFIALVDCMPRLVPQGQTADSATWARVIRAAHIKAD